MHSAVYTVTITVQCTVHTVLYIQPIENTASSRGVTRGLAPSISITETLKLNTYRIIDVLVPFT